MLIYSFFPPALLNGCQGSELWDMKLWQRGRQRNYLLSYYSLSRQERQGDIITGAGGKFVLKKVCAYGKRGSFPGNASGGESQE